MKLKCRLQGLILSSDPPYSAKNILTVLDVLPTSKGSPLCEVLIIPHTVWDRSLI